jgi:hypothetical protein
VGFGFHFMKDIKGYEGLYAVTKDGRVWAYPKYNRKIGRFRSLCHDPNGYPWVALSKDGKIKRYRVHRLVAQTHISNPHNAPCVNHIDGIKTNNNVGNLEWCTKIENNRHARAIGLVTQQPPHFAGEDCPSSKLKESDIREIRELREKQKMSFPKIALRFNVTHQTIQRIVNRTAWKHVK